MKVELQIGRQYLVRHHGSYPELGFFKGVFIRENRVILTFISSETDREFSVLADFSGKIKEVKGDETNP